MIRATRDRNENLEPSETMKVQIYVVPLLLPSLYTTYSYTVELDANLSATLDTGVGSRIYCCSHNWSRESKNPSRT